MLDMDATDDPLHGDQEGRFFHGYYRSYCYLPLYIFDGRHLLVAKLRRANIDASAGAKEEIARIVAHLRKAWPSCRSGRFGTNVKTGCWLWKALEQGLRRAALSNSPRTILHVLSAIQRHPACRRRPSTSACRER